MTSLSQLNDGDNSSRKQAAPLKVDDHSEMVDREGISAWQHQVTSVQQTNRPVRAFEKRRGKSTNKLNEVSALTSILLEGRHVIVSRNRLATDDRLESVWIDLQCSPYEI